MNLQRVEYYPNIKQPFIDKSGSEDIPFIIERKWRNPFVLQFSRHNESVDYWNPVTNLVVNSGVYAPIITPIMCLSLSAIKTFRSIADPTTPAFTIDIDVYQGGFLEMPNNDLLTTSYVKTVSFSMSGNNGFKIVSLPALPCVFFIIKLETSQKYTPVVDKNNLLVYLHTEVSL